MNVNNAKKILVFDTETTGLIQNDNRNVEVFPYIIQLAHIDTIYQMEKLRYRVMIL